MEFAAQAGGKVEAVIACGCWCRMCPSPCALANLHPLTCRPPATRSRYTIPQVGTSYIWKVRRKAPGKSLRIYTTTSLRMWGWLLRRWLLLFSWVSTEQVTGLAYHSEGLWSSGSAFCKSLKSCISQPKPVCFWEMYWAANAASRVYFPWFCLVALGGATKHLSWGYRVNLRGQCLCAI